MASLDVVRLDRYSFAVSVSCFNHLITMTAVRAAILRWTHWLEALKRSLLVDVAKQKP